MNIVLVRRCDNASYIKQKGYEIGNITEDTIEILGIESEIVSALLKEKNENFNVNLSDFERDTRFLLYLRKKKAKNLDSKIRNNK